MGLYFGVSCVFWMIWALLLDVFACSVTTVFGGILSLVGVRLVMVLLRIFSRWLSLVLFGIPHWPSIFFS